MLPKRQPGPGRPLKPLSSSKRPCLGGNHHSDHHHGDHVWAGIPIATIGWESPQRLCQARNHHSDRVREGGNHHSDHVGVGIPIANMLGWESPQRPCQGGNHHSDHVRAGITIATMLGQESPQRPCQGRNHHGDHVRVGITKATMFQQTTEGIRMPPCRMTMTMITRAACSSAPGSFARADDQSFQSAKLQPTIRGLKTVLPLAAKFLYL